MCSPADFLANHSVMPGSEEARMMTVISGRTCSAALTKSSPLGSLLKMLLESSRWSSRARFLQWQVRQLFSTRTTTFEDTNCEKPLPCNASATTLNATDTKSSRCLFRLVPLELPTEEIECLFLGNVTTSTGGYRSEKFIGKGKTPNPLEYARIITGQYTPFLKTPCTADSYTDKMKSKGVSGTSGTLAQEIVNGFAEKHRGLILPTPIATEIEHRKRIEELKAAGGQTMASRANGESRPNGLMDFMNFYDMLPTPQAVEGTNYTNTWNPNSQMGQSLSAMAGSGMLPTPRSNVVNGCDLNNPKLADRKKSNLEEEVAKAIVSTNLETVGEASRLSPLFTEEMMGFPLMWTVFPFLSQNGAPKASKPTETH